MQKSSQNLLLFHGKTEICTIGNSICFFLKSLGGYVREKGIKDNRPMYDQLLAEVAKGNVVRLRNGIYALPDEMAKTMIDVETIEEEITGTGP